MPEEDIAPEKSILKDSIDPGRRNFVMGGSFFAAVGGLFVSYGAFAGHALRFLYPAKTNDLRWLYVGNVDAIDEGSALDYKTPQGASVTIARQGSTGSAEDFIALSSVCPHLGCQVHWEGQNDRFFCPCHNGAFDPKGKGIAGPPGDAGQSLPQYPLKIEKGLLYIEVSVIAVS